MQVISTEKLPIKMWLNNIEEGALEQAKNLANLPFAFKHIAIMPDSHQGYGMPIGGVMATKCVIVPNAVGVDIGCGMCSVHTGLKEIDTDSIKHIMGEIRSLVPVGFNHHKEVQKWDGFADAPHLPVIDEQLEKAHYQLGTLGGGNHFIELQRAEDGIYLMVHSGSRNFGYQIAKVYHEKAMELCGKYFSNIPDKELSFLPKDSTEYWEYVCAMNFALSFALENRLRMVKAIELAFQTVIGDVKFGEVLNIHHNYAAMEHHFGENVIVHRKGATRAYKDELGIIPGSQGTKSYIVKGLGNEQSFCSCSHGAGRKMGRKEASRKLNLEEEIKILDNQGIIHGIRNVQDLDEASGAYKDISEVMENQKDLVAIVKELQPIAVIKA